MSLQSSLLGHLIQIISDTNGLTLKDTLELLITSPRIQNKLVEKSALEEYLELLDQFHRSEIDIKKILAHPVSKALTEFLKRFPLPYHEEHIHLTGSMDAAFIFPRIQQLLAGEHAKIYEKKITEVYGAQAIPINSIDDVQNLIQLKDGEKFHTYLRILYLSKLVLNSKEAHRDAAFHLANRLYSQYNVGSIRLKFTLSRQTTLSSEQIPGLDQLTEEDVLLGLYEGFELFKQKVPHFNFHLSPSFRKEAGFYDSENYKSKEEHFNYQVQFILEMLEKHPFLRPHLAEIDTVGDERNLYRKVHFEEMRAGMRKLQYRGFRIRSHHGETWKSLQKGIQSVDNAMNIWHIDTLEHGLSIGINPNYYYQRLYQKIIEHNKKSIPIPTDSIEANEILDMRWSSDSTKNKILNGAPLSYKEEMEFVKTKFHHAREIEHYQHDVLNRMINKKVGLVALPTSNMKLTPSFPDYKDHPFSWWEKKGVRLGVGTDNDITLSTNYLEEMLILLISDMQSLKITKLLMVTTKEVRRPYMGHLLWQMRKSALTLEQDDA